MFINNSMAMAHILSNTAVAITVYIYITIIMTYLILIVDA